MKFQIVLLDKSEIIKKMLSHCLHYFVVEIHSFSDWNTCLMHVSNQVPKMIFVDWELSFKSTPLIFLAREKLKSIPSILMYRTDVEKEISKIDKNVIPYRITKPLNPNEVRKIFTTLVPEITENSIHSFLSYPKPKETKAPESPPELPEKKEKPFEKNETKTGLMGYINETKTKPSLVNKSLGSPQKLEQNIKTLDKSDENVINKATVSKSFSQITSNQINEKQILDVIMKYKESLEFSKMMEKVLVDYAQEAVSKILKPDQLKTVLKEPLQDFQSSEKFKKLVEKEVSTLLSAYLEKQIPLMIKSKIEDEIKKILQEIQNVSSPR
ncbi:MAG: hypothetical protein GDA46_02015 [Bdellovibrionales bacterium]|nr:hypothetical protein [Bdellovibrionales bacterium]